MMSEIYRPGLYQYPDGVPSSTSSPDRQEAELRLASNFYKATVLVLNDRPTKPVDILFFHGRAPGDEGNLFEAAADLFKQGMVKNIMIVGTDGEHKGQEDYGTIYAGKHVWTTNLHELGVRLENIIPSPKVYNTKEENNAFVEASRNRGWSSAATLAHPYQVLRATLGTIRTMRDLNYKIRVWTVTQDNIDWNEAVLGPQASESKFRIDQIMDEFVRIPRYQEKGDLASFQELYDYLEWRDAGS